MRNHDQQTDTAKMQYFLQFPTFLQGITDKKNGIVDHNYDKWKERDQRYYEYGRFAYTIFKKDTASLGALPGHYLTVNLPNSCRCQAAKISWMGTIKYDPFDEFWSRKRLTGDWMKDRLHVLEFGL